MTTKSSNDDTRSSFAGADARLRPSPRSWGSTRTSEANDAFNRALRTRPSDEQVVLREEESLRLDKLATKVQSREDLADEDVKRQLRTISSSAARRSSPTEAGCDFSRRPRMGRPASPHASATETSSSFTFSAGCRSGSSET